MDRRDQEKLFEKHDHYTSCLKEDSRLHRPLRGWLLRVRSYLFNPRLIRSTLQPRVKRFGYALVPQLLRTYYFGDPSPTGNKIHSTSWMNGLRGLAALTVLNCHYLAYFTRTIFIGFGAEGYNPLSSNYWIHQLPIFEFIGDGTLSVDVFFVIGGYVCSQKAIQLMTKGDKTGLFQSLPASVFRRCFRIYLPVMCATLLTTILAYLGAYEPTRFLLNDEVKNKLYLGPASEHHPPQFEKLSEFVAWWWSDIFDIMNFYKENHPKPILDPHLWTIHHEFRTSMHLYLVLLGTALCKPWARIAMLIALSYIYVGFYTHWVEVSYFWGAVLAQLDVLRTRKERAKPVESQERVDAADDWRCKSNDRKLPVSIYSGNLVFNPRHHLVLSSIRTLLYFSALILMSYPKNAPYQPTPFFDIAVKSWIPAVYTPGRAPHFPKQIGVSLLVYLIGSVPAQQRAKSLWHRFLTLGVPQYLGSIMFGMYLLHGPILHLIGFAVPQFVWKAWSGEYGETTEQGLGIYLLGLFTGWLITLILLLWAADVWTREVEGRCVKLTKWLESIVFVQE